MQHLSFKNLYIKNTTQPDFKKHLHQHGTDRLHTGITPSKKLNPQVTAANPLLSKHTYQLHVYDHEKPAPANSKYLHPYHMHKENWVPGGSIVFHGDGKSLSVAGHTIQQATWQPAKSLITWSSQPGAIPNGSLSFADHKVSALGAISDATGQEVSVAATSLASYTTTRYKASATPDTAVDFAVFTYGAEAPTPGAPLETIDYMDFDAGQNPKLPSGGQDDISTDCTINPQTGFGDPLIITKIYSNQYQYSFDITFDFTLTTFTGTYVEGVLKTKYNWSGTYQANPTQEFDVSPTLVDHPIFGQQIEDATATTSGAVSADSTPSTLKVTALAAPPIAAVALPPDPTPATAPPTLQSLLHLSSIRATKDADGKEVVEDYAQESANNVYQRILLGSVPQTTQDSLFPNLPSLSADQLSIKKKNAAFFNIAGVPYLAQYIANNEYVSQDIKGHVNMDRITLFWNAVGSFQAPPAGTPDPVVQFGWDRNSQSFKDIQAAFAQQNIDTYQLGYKLGVPAFTPFLNDPKNWHDQLSAYLTDSKFLARWSSQNATPGYTDGHRQLYEWQTQLTCLQNAAISLNLKVNVDTQTVISQLATAILLPSFDSVNWTDEMKQEFEQQANSILSYTQDQLDQIMKENLEEYNAIMAFKAGISIYGSVSELVGSTDATFRTIQAWYLRKFNLSLNVSDLGQIQEQYRYAFTVNGDDIRSRGFIQTVGDGYIEECAEALQPEAARWRKWAAAAQEFGSTVMAGLTPLLYAAGVGAIIYGLVKDNGHLPPLSIIQLTGIALELSIKALSSVAATKLGTWLQENLLSRNGISKTLGQWFTEDGIAVVDETSVLVKLLGSSSAEFLVNRLGPALALVAVGVSIESLVTAIRDGTKTDIIYASINVALAVINVAVVFVGIAASAAEAGTALALAGAWCGPIGLLIALVGIVVGIISIFVHDQPSVANPPEDFVNGPVKDEGYYK